MTVLAEEGDRRDCTRRRRRRGGGGERDGGSGGSVGGRGRAALLASPCSRSSRGMERERDDERAVDPRVRDDVVADELLFVWSAREGGSEATEGRKGERVFELRKSRERKKTKRAPFFLSLLPLHPQRPPPRPSARRTGTCRKPSSRRRRAQCGSPRRAPGPRGRRAPGVEVEPSKRGSFPPPSPPLHRFRRRLLRSCVSRP